MLLEDQVRGASLGQTGQTNGRSCVNEESCTDRDVWAGCCQQGMLFRGE
jgi:hypothetical protein